MRRRQAILTAAGALALALGALEAGLRLLYRRESARIAVLSAESYYYTDISGRRRHIPGSVGRAPSFDGAALTEYRVNSLGFLDDELARPKPAGERRVLFLGDSVVLGGGMPRSETFIERAERLLDSAPGGPVEIINAGVGDSGLAESLALLGESLPEVSPDLVALGVYLNDSRPPQGFADELLFESPLLRALHASALLRRSYLANFVVYRLYRRRSADRVEFVASRRFGWVPGYKEGSWLKDTEALRRLVAEARYDWGAAWLREEMEKLIAGIEAHRRLCAREGIPFAVVLFPVDLQLLSTAPWKELRLPQRALRFYLEQNGVPYLDLLDIVSREDARAAYYDHCHLSPEGHALAARAIAPFLGGRLEQERRK